MTKATTETNRIAELEATVLALTKRIDEYEVRYEERLDRQSGTIGALATASMVLQLAMRIEDVGKRLGFAEQKETIEALLLKQHWSAQGGRGLKMLAAAQHTSGAAFDWIEKMMEPLIAKQRSREEGDRRFEEDLEHGSMPVNFFEKLKAADRTHLARIGTFEDVKQGNAPDAPRMNRFYTP